ncbi:unnamed protein product [Protopolystoma xenopodis]|uniref:LEM domain-containing protein n=1 Tax=Protopolystoma xenopodis TaxID=117903 RepID=A0A448X776_9PLAT|nr:unnamed protein product [Protopolystoma xenopodis]
MAGQLSDDQLRSKLISLGVEIGPIVPTTRKLYERKLSKLLNAESTRAKAPHPQPNLHRPKAPPLSDIKPSESKQPEHSIAASERPLADRSTHASVSVIPDSQNNTMNDDELISLAKDMSQFSILVLMNRIIIRIDCFKA